jgi:hypothetical protein
MYEKNKRRKQKRLTLDSVIIQDNEMTRRLFKLGGRCKGHEEGRRPDGLLTETHFGITAVEPSGAAVTELVIKFRILRSYLQLRKMFNKESSLG